MFIASKTSELIFRIEFILNAFLILYNIFLNQNATYDQLWPSIKSCEGTYRLTQQLQEFEGVESLTEVYSDFVLSPATSNGGGVKSKCKEPVHTTKPYGRM